jgi:tetratricopeptide (TPR) repeat protein
LSQAVIAAPENPNDKPLPDREIKYEEKFSPEWKENWDLARELYRDEKYSEALVQYEILFTQKANIDEARWEYLTILLHIERWENAKTALEKLLTAEPASIRYRIAMAKVCMEIGDLDKAVEIYSQLLNSPVSEPEKKQILNGLIQTFELQGKTGNILVPLKELVKLDSDNHQLQLKLATFELANGNITRAQELSSLLEQVNPLDVSILSLQAEIKEAQNKKDEAATYWQKVIGLDPDSVNAHKHLYEFYREIDNPAMSFKHLEQLIRIEPNNIDFLMGAAELNIQLGRLDRTLEYYEFALAVDPANPEVLKAKIAAQKILAQDLLSLIENDVEKKIWQDLDKVAPDSIGVYREVANLLREQKKIDELINVLKLLYTKVPGDVQVKQELVLLLQQQGRIDDLTALKLIPIETEPEKSVIKK